MRQEVEEVVGVLAGGVEADDEGDGGVSAAMLVESLAELVVAVGGLGEREFGGGGLEVVAEEGGVVAVARGVDADAEADAEWLGGGGAEAGGASMGSPGGGRRRGPRREGPRRVGPRGSL